MISSLITLIFVLIIVGLIVWLVQSVLPVPPPFKNIIIVLVVLVLILWLLGYVGAFGPGYAFGPHRP